MQHFPHGFSRHSFCKHGPSSNSMPTSFLRNHKAWGGISPSRPSVPTGRWGKWGWFWSFSQSSPLPFLFGPLLTDKPAPPPHLREGGCGKKDARSSATSVTSWNMLPKPPPTNHRITVPSSGHWFGAHIIDALWRKPREVRRHSGPPAGSLSFPPSRSMPTSRAKFTGSRKLFPRRCENGV